MKVCDFKDLQQGPFNSQVRSILKKFTESIVEELDLTHLWN